MGRKRLSDEERQKRLLEKAEKKNSFDRRGRSLNPNKLRNLPQYKDMPDEDFELMVAKKEMKAETSQAFEKRIEAKLEKFEEDYDLTDLKINDREVLRGLVQSIISLEDYEQEIFKLRTQGMGGDNLFAIDKLQKVMSDIRKSISDAQNDLAITRKHRKSDQETSVIAYIDSVKEKAKKFIEAKHAFIFCPTCHTLLMTNWSLYPKENNRINLICMQKDKDGNPCNTKFTVTTKELLENRQVNEKGVMPDSLL
jgi:hypothetical protein